MSQYFLRTHNALRAGKHFDLHIEGDGGTYYSWALRYFPTKVGEKRLAIRTEKHTREGASFTGTIGPGYGAGETHVVHEGEAVWSGYKDVRLIGLGNFSLVQMSDKQWLLIKRS